MLAKTATFPSIWHRNKRHCLVPVIKVYLIVWLIKHLGWHLHSFSHCQRMAYPQIYRTWKYTLKKTHFGWLNPIEIPLKRHKISDHVLIQMVIFNNFSIEIPFQFVCCQSTCFPLKKTSFAHEHGDFPSISQPSSHSNPIKMLIFPWTWWFFTQIPIEIPWKTRAFSAKSPWRLTPLRALSVLLTASWPPPPPVPAWRIGKSMAGIVSYSHL